MRIGEPFFEALFAARCSSFARYLLGIAFAAGAVLCRMAFDGAVTGVQFLTFFPAIIFGTLLCGPRVGLLVAVLCGVASWYLIETPWVSRHPTQGFAYALYLLVAGWMVWAMGAMRRLLKERRKAEQRQRLLGAELRHRTRNLLGVVSSISKRSLHASSSFSEYEERFNSRLRALGRVQALLGNGDEKIELGTLVRSELIAHGADPTGVGVHVAGPPVLLPRDAVQPLALALHELATNALKYGALAQDAGCLSVTWNMAAGRIMFEWRESGLIMTSRESCSPGGFGRELIEKMLPMQLGAQTSFEFTPDGIFCRIEVAIGAS